MSYFYGQPMQHPNPPPNYQAQTSQIDPHFQPLPSNPLFQNPSFAFDPLPNSGVYPPNYSGFVAQNINQLENSGVSTNWVVKQAAPILYSPAIQSVRTEHVASTGYEAVNYNSVGQTLVKRVRQKKIKSLKLIPKKPAVSQSVRCELCRIDCDTVEVYEKHLQGKKHNKGLLKLYASTPQRAAVQASQPSNVGCSAGQVVTPGEQSVPGVPCKPVTLEDKKQILLDGGTAIQSIKVCTICNVICNGEIAFADHLAGKKHLVQERAHGTAVSNPVEINAQHIISKKRKNEEPASMWCDVCKISCTSTDLLKIHYVGKKHQKNLQKLRNSNYNTNALGSTPASLPITNSSTGINTASFNTPCPQPNQAKKEPKDVKTKKRNIMECGAAADALKTCTICNVVCNSDKVFYSHLTGQKHAAMVKQIQAASASNGLQVVYPAVT